MGMIFTISGYAPLTTATIPLNGLTVIAGENSTGKSTISKLLFSLIKAANRSRSASIHSAAAARGLLRTHLNLVLGRDSRSGRLSLSAGGGTCTAAIAISGDVSDFFFADCPLRDAVFIETPIVWQLFPTFQGITAHNAEVEQLRQGSKIQYPYTLSNVYGMLNESVPGRGEVYEDILGIVKRISGGQVEFKDGVPSFHVGESTTSIVMKSLSTGIQSLSLLQRILELGLAESARILLLDEPEVHLHPKWQLEYAKILVKLVKETDMPILLTTHSAIFVEALEYIGRKEIPGKCSFLLAERESAESEANVRNVTENLEPIYAKLAYPLMRLSLKQGDA
jgi:energy-coupling factor transporter ATP-binding protein EcfA2